MELDTCITKWPSRKSGMKLPPRKGSAASAAMTRPISTAPTRRKCAATPCDRPALPGLQHATSSRASGRASCRRSNSAHSAGVAVSATSKRGQHRQDEGQRQRADEMPLHAGGEQFGQEHRDDDQGGIDHRAAHFQRGVAITSSRGCGVGQLRVLAQPAQDILDADDGVVHQHAQRHGEAAQGHGVQRLAHAVQHRHRRQQRQRNGQEGDQRRAPVAQEQIQHRQDQDRGDHQRLFQDRPARVR